jgi:hypothetical protein
MPMGSQPEQQQNSGRRKSELPVGTPYQELFCRQTTKALPGSSKPTLWMWLYSHCQWGKARGILDQIYGKSR